MSVFDALGQALVSTAAGLASLLFSALALALMGVAVFKERAARLSRKRHREERS